MSPGSRADRELEAARMHGRVVHAAYRPVERMAGPCEGCPENSCPDCRVVQVAPAEPFHEEACLEPARRANT